MAEVHQQQRYRVIEKLASGGMAEVWKARMRGGAVFSFKKPSAIM